MPSPAASVGREQFSDALFEVPRGNRVVHGERGPTWNAPDVDDATKAAGWHLPEVAVALLGCDGL
jgi:hypothetical protein